MNNNLGLSKQLRPKTS